MLVRVRILLPDTTEAGAYLASLAAHAVIVGLALVAAGRADAPPLDRPSISVQLRAGAPQTPPPEQEPTARQAPAKEPEPESEPEAEKKPEPEPEPPPEEEPAPKAKIRRHADEPETVSEPDEGPQARPEELPEADEPSPPAAGAADEDSEQRPAPAPGAGAGVAGVETEQPFTADWYIQLVAARLSAAWVNRPLLPPGSRSQTVVVAFRIESDGAITGARVHTPSGYAPLDLSALNAVRSVGSLPPLPRGYDQDHLGARFAFRLDPPRR